MKTFSQKKFLGLSSQQQHKACMKLLEAAYQGDTGRITEYNELAGWMETARLPEAISCKEVSDRFHWHREQGDVHLKEHKLLPTVREGDRETALSPPLPVAVYLDNIRSAHNVGSILRSAEAFGLGTVHFSETMAFADHKQVRDASMGAWEWVKCERGSAIQDLPRPLIALETSPEATSIYDFDFPETFTLVVGNEEYGCSDAILEAADVIIEIPLYGRKNSLNVANAFAAAAAEIRRQALNNLATFGPSGVLDSARTRTLSTDNRRAL